MSLGISYPPIKSPQWKSTQPDHREIIGGTMVVPPLTEDTLYWGGRGDNQDVHVELLRNSTEDDPVVRITGHSYSGAFDFTCHIKSIDPRNASYAEMCALVAWEDKVNPSEKNHMGGMLMPTPLGMDVGNVTRRQNFLNLSQQYHSSGKFGPSIADQTKNLLALYDKLVPESDSPEGHSPAYSVYRKAADDALMELMKLV